MNKPAQSDAPEQSEQPEHTEAERPKDRYRRILETGTNTERTIFFSDAVMAIAMTLLVLEINIPKGSGSQLVKDLLADAPSFYAYVLAFVLISVNWLSHHRKFNVIARYDARLQVINLGFLFFIAVMPLSVRIMALHGMTPIAVMLYAATIALPSLFQWWLWSYAWRAKLFSPVVDLGMSDAISLRCRSYFSHRSSCARSGAPFPRYSAGSRSSRSASWWGVGSRGQKIRPRSVLVKVEAELA